MRKVAVLTGTRADYGIYSSVLEAMDKRSDLSYELIVTGMHLSNKFGNSIREIKKDKRKIGACVPMLKYGDTLAGMAKNTGLAVIGIAAALEKIKPDVLLVLGDRGEQLAAAIAGAHMNIPVAHLHGGEVSGTIDESIRHAISKFAHLHLVATRKSRERLIKLGERKEDIYVVGAPGIDALKKKANMPREAVARYFGFDPKRIIVLAVQHPVTTEFGSAKKNMKALVDALMELNEQTVCIYSNSDAGYTMMMEALVARAKEFSRVKNIKIYKTLPHGIYLNLMKQADVMVGNSSSGIIEAPSAYIPYVLVGSRQNGRERTKSILEAGYDKKQILKAIRKALGDVKFRKRIKSCVRPYEPFCDADAGVRTAKILANFKITPQLLQKRITY